MGFLEQFNPAEMEEERKSFHVSLDRDIAEVIPLIIDERDRLKFDAMISEVRGAANRMFTSIAEAALIAQKYIKR